MSHSSSNSTSSHGSVKSYVTGLLLSLVLTVIPFAVVMSGALSTVTTVVVIAVTAVLQILVQLVMFMHMNTNADEGWNVMSFVFTLTILVLVVGGLFMDHAASASQHDDRLTVVPSRWRDLLALTKPGIIGGNLIATLGGYFLAAHGTFDWVTFSTVMLGIALVIASGCACNNVIDRDIDALMARTRHRPLAKGRISITQALGVSALLGVAGVVCLALGTNGLTVALAVIGWGVYVGLYSLYMKRHSEYGTLVGSLSGAMPPVVGYCAVTGQFDSGAFMLLVIFCLWQMPHSYAIAIFRYADYRRASIPVLPVVHGIKRAKHHILGYIVAFIPASLALVLASQAGTGYLCVALAMGGYWLYLALCGFRLGDDVRWAKKVFGVSILTITAMSLVMVLEAMVPMWA